jgi:hypothetical protein
VHALRISVFIRGLPQVVGLMQPRPRPSIFIYIFLIFSAFSHEKTGTR